MTTVRLPEPDSGDLAAADLAAAAPVREAVLDWLLRVGRLGTDIPSVLDALCRRLVEAGLPLARVSLSVRLLHPQVRSMNYYWRRGRPAVETVERAHGSELSEGYLTSPVYVIVEQKAEALRFRLETMEPPWPFPVLGELVVQGITDYTAMAMHSTGGRRDLATFATDRPGGFSVADLAVIDGILPAFSAVMETLSLRRLAATVLDTYVGRQTGSRILSGDIRRGSGAELRAVLWYCDLRGFTSLADRLPRDALISLLNGYFEIMGGAVEARGAEILKFIGDAMLAIFPLPPGDGDAVAQAAAEQRACRLALDAARDALARIDERNAERAAWGEPTLKCGIALHLGDVMYGNIGSPSRLDFTVIGPAVNLVSRIEGLCKRLGRTVLTSAALARSCADDLVSAGHHAVAGLTEPVEVFELVHVAS